MNVLHVIPTLDLSYGGPSHAVRGMVRGLQRQGVQVTVATTRNGTIVALDGVSVVQARLSKSPLLPASFFFAPDLARWLDDSVAQFDLVHVHTLFNYPAARACVAARRHGVPYVVRPCGMLDPWSLRRSRLKKQLWMRLVERRNLDHASALHFTSSVEQRVTTPLRATTRGVVIPLGVDEPQKLSGQSKACGEKTVLFMARLHPKKGLEVLIPALAGLMRRRDDFTFVLAGSGERDYEQKVRRLLAAHGIDSRTRWMGFVEGEEKAALLAGADVFVLPSYQENFGLAVAEAMAAGVPVVISDCINIHNDVTARGAGVVTRPVADELAVAIEQLLDDGDLRQRMGANGHRLAREKFSWPHVAQELVNLYEQILSAGART